MDGISAVLLLMMLFVYLLVIAISVAVYVLGAIGLMKMAKSCGISYGWMAFIPFANSYLMGKIAEQNPTPGKKSWPWRHLALIGEIVITLLAVALVIYMVVDMAAAGVLDGADYSEYDLIAFYGGILGFLGVVEVLSLLYNVVVYIIYWKIFSLFAPDMAVVFLILSLLLTVAPIIFFFIRNRTPVNRPGPSGDQWV